MTRHAKPIPARDLQAIFLPRGRHCYLVPANDTHAPDNASGGPFGIILMLSIAALIGAMLAIGGVL